MSSLLKIVMEARNNFERQGELLAKRALEIVNFDELGNVLATHFMEALYSPGSAVREWFEETLGWIYTGFHISVTAFNIYASTLSTRQNLESGRLSLTFRPQSGQPALDENKAYFDEGWNFTTFLWPKDRQLRNILCEPLVFTLPQSQSDAQSFVSQDNSTIIIPWPLISTLRDVLTGGDYIDYPSLLYDEQFAQISRGIIEHLRAQYSQVQDDDHRAKLHAYFSSELEAQNTARRLASTIKLHTLLNISPASVVFIPVTLFGERQGVICFVLSKPLSAEDQIALRLICDSAFLALRRPDREVAGIIEAQAAKIRSAEEASAMTHELSKILGRAQDLFCQIELEYDQIPEPSRRYLMERIQKMKKLHVSIEGLYKEFAKQLATPDIAKIIQICDVVKQSLDRLAAIDGLEFLAPINVSWEKSTVRIEAVPQKLIVAITEIIRNALTAVKKALPSGPKPEVTISFDSNETEVILTVSDNGPGMSANDLWLLKKRMDIFDAADALLSGKSGYGLIAAHSIITGSQKGKLHISRADQGGLACKIHLPIAKESHDKNEWKTVSH